MLFHSRSEREAEWGMGVIRDFNLERWDHIAAELAEWDRAFEERHPRFEPRFEAEHRFSARYGYEQNVTVRELIEALGKLDPDLPVGKAVREYGEWGYREATGVEVVEGEYLEGRDGLPRFAVLRAEIPQ